MTSSNDVLIEGISESKSSSPHMDHGLEFSRGSLLLRRRKSEVFVEISEQCKVEAAKQTSHLIQLAEKLCNKSPNSQRKGQVLKKIAPQVEEHVFNGIQQEICEDMWLKAAQHVYGTPHATKAKSCKEKRVKKR